MGIPTNNKADVQWWALNAHPEYEARSKLTSGKWCDWMEGVLRTVPGYNKRGSVWTNFYMMEAVARGAKTETADLCVRAAMRDESEAFWARKPGEGYDNRVRRYLYCFCSVDVPQY
jgi:hypothetical protein